MDTHTVDVLFPDAHVAGQSQLIAELQEFLADSGWARGSLAVRREREDTQDPGTILSIILSSGAAIALAKGLATFASKVSSRIRVELPTGEKLVITGDAATQAHVAEVVAAALKRSGS